VGFGGGALTRGTLYGEGPQLALGAVDDLIDGLAGASPAFIRELLRRSVLIAAEESDEPPPRLGAAGAA
jgi:hypothetical protein